MRRFCFAIFGALMVAPALLASTIYDTSASAPFSYTASATYQVVSNGQRITSQGFTTATTSTDPATLTLTLNYGALAGTVISSATLDLSRVLSAGSLNTTRTLSHSLNRTHTVGSDPVFSSAATGIFVSIVGTLGGTHTVNLANATNYNLLPFFLSDLEAGNPLVIHLSLSDVFSTTSLASGAWRSETATYKLSQLVKGTFSASTSVLYTPAISSAPEPATLLLSGVGLVLLSICGKKFRNS